MRLVLLIRRGDADGVRGFLRAVDRAYSRVPMVGELVMLDDQGDIGHAVDQVSWDNDGTAVLRFTAPAVSDDWLLSVGFELVYRA
ncbi:hypothetical protein BH23ACT10_BH23ACT10_07610 [soil metagenome]